MAAELESRGSGSLEARTVCVCSGLELVNITYNSFVAADEKTAKVRMQDTTDNCYKSIIHKNRIPQPSDSQQKTIVDSMDHQ